jgi:Fe-Mn family superoxide dismutase
MKTSRKNFIKTTALLGSGIIFNQSSVKAAVQKVNQLSGNYPFTLPPLGYAYQALEPFIDAQTMELHHTKHHQAYVTKLNEAIQVAPELQSKTLEELIGAIQSLPEKIRNAVRNHGGGHWNHSFFWESLKTGTTPSEKLINRINQNFGSQESFKTQFEKAALGQFGSGWAWLIENKEGKLIITATPNQDNPLMDIVAEKGKPILALDVWEHAYYLKYQNKRADYCKAFWSVLNWQKVEENLNNK